MIRVMLFLSTKSRALGWNAARKIIWKSMRGRGCLPDRLSARRISGSAFSSAPLSILYARYRVSHFFISIFFWINGNLKMYSCGSLKLCSIVFAINQLFIVYNLLFTIYIVWVYYVITKMPLYSHFSCVHISPFTIHNLLFTIHYLLFTLYKLSNSNNQYRLTIIDTTLDSSISVL